MSECDVSMAVVTVIAFWFWLKLKFYRSYFQQKQKGLGKNPDDTLREEFGWLWRLVK